MAKKKAAKKTTARKPVPRTPGSMADQINSLEPGRSVAVAERFDIMEIGHGGGMSDAMNRMRSGQAAYVARVRDELDAREFKVESGTFITDDKTGAMAVVVITRME
jgi:hypothetical protein